MRVFFINKHTRWHFSRALQNEIVQHTSFSIIALDFAASQEFDAWNVPEGSGAVVQGKEENEDEVLPYADLKAKYGDTPKGPKKLF